MIKFFQTKGSIIAAALNHQPSAEETAAMEWLFEGKVINDEQLNGCFVGPRREMITPWSTNAVEITQNMSLKGVQRIEEYFKVESKEASYDPMLQRMYDGLNQQIFDVNIQPEPINHV